MRELKQYINKTINEFVEAMKHCELVGQYEQADDYERMIADYKKQLDILEPMIKEGEGNLIRFNEDGTFELWAIHCTGDGDMIVEHYEDDMTFALYEEYIEMSKCRDVSSEFDIDKVMLHTTVTDEPRKWLGYGGYFLAPEEAMRI